jgi:sortase A
MMLTWARRVLFGIGIAALVYCAVVVIDTRLFQASELRQLNQARVPGAPLRTVLASGLIGRIEIPRLAISVAVMEGAGAKTLRRAVGHIPGTALPGRAGNIGLSGHRDTFFRPLRNIRQDDVVTLVTTGGDLKYRVVSIKIVSPDDVSVLASDQLEILTLVTCYPFYFVGPAPKRFIVRAERIL